MVRKSILSFLFSFFAVIHHIIAQTYFQQEVNYKIDVRLDDQKHELYANESMEYINNSPNELTYIYIHLWPNAYKNNKTALAKDLLRHEETALYYAKEEERGYIDSLDFKVNGETVRWELLKDSIDICILYLNKPLKSGSSINITTPFHVKIPSGKISRLGHLGQSYQITQWYPKPAVYDKNGWNQMPYLNQGEFYSEFASFDVSISLPKNYVLAATGDIVNGENELKWLEENVKKTETTEVFDAYDMKFPPSDTEFKTLRFKQSNVHDFAWFCDKRYHVLKGKVELPHSGKEVNTWVMFTNAEARYWKYAIDYINDAVYHYSLWNGDYPYNNCTAVDGTISAGGGMEYPNVTVIGEAGSDFRLDQVIAHEVGHNWFYGIIGSNERLHPWMDEGINSFYENRYIETLYPNNRLIGSYTDKKWAAIFDLRQYRHKAEYELSYLFNAAKNEDQPIELPSSHFTSLNYGGIVYSKSALVFDYLMAYLGEETMDRAMREYYDEWKFKHPTPEDFRKSIETSTGRNLSWLFDDLLNSTKKLDYKISFSYQMNDGSWRIGVKNKGEILAPVFIQGIKNDKLVAMVIYDGFADRAVLDFPPTDIDYFKIDYMNDMPEINRNNNIARTKGAFKKIEPFKLQFLGSLDNPDKTQLFFSPVAGWNNYNKWMWGMVFHNITIPQKKFEYTLMPMYSPSTKDVTGYGKVMFNRLPKHSNIFRQVSFGASASKYSFSSQPFDMMFTKLAPELVIDFKKRKATSPVSHQIAYRNINLWEDDFDVFFVTDVAGNTVSYSKKVTKKNFNEFSYFLKIKDALHPFNLKANIQQGEKIIKTSIVANLTRNFKKDKKGIDVRFFAGSFLGTSSANAGPYRYRLSGQRGYQDYLYDNVYLGRTETSGILANQFTETDGGFKFYSPIGQTTQWITALNIKSSIGNLKLPLNLFFDIGITGNDGRTTETIVYDAGVYVPVIKNIFEIYFPLITAQGFMDYKAANGLSYLETVRFTLNLNQLNPFYQIKKLEL